jgi:hypothetical protein
MNQKEIAKEEGISTRQVRRCGKFADAVDLLDHRIPGAKDRLLSVLGNKMFPSR